MTDDPPTMPPMSQDEPKTNTKVEPIWVEATVNLPGLARGERILADPTSEWITDHLRTGFLVRIHLPDA